MVTNYFVVDAPGHYGDKAAVLSAHVTLDEAHRYVGRDRGLCVRRGSLAKGAAWLRAYENVYPIAEVTP